MNKFNDNQRDLLISFMEANPKLAKTTLDHSFTKEMSNKKWDELANRLNSLGGANKTVKQWKRSWTDLKMMSKKKAAIMKKQLAKTGGGPLSSGSEEDESEELARLLREDSPVEASAARSFNTAAGGFGNSAGHQVAHERILSIIGKTAVEGIRGIKELGLEQYIDSDSDEMPDEPLPKRPNLGAASRKPSKEATERVASKKQLAAQWLDNSKKKIEATEKVAEALNNIASQIARIADSFELYNAQIN